MSTAANTYINTHAGKHAGSRTGNHTSKTYNTAEPSKSTYDSIINETRPASTRARMPMRDRAAQFMPFAAVVGFSESVIAAEQELKE